MFTMYRPTNRIHMVYNSNIIYGKYQYWFRAILERFSTHTQQIPCETWTHSSTSMVNSDFWRKKIILQNIVEISGMYRAHCYFTVGWAGINDMPDNRQDFIYFM